MMGAGKSSVGRSLAELSGREFLDTDLILQNKLGRPIPQLFSVYGESAFRDHESSVLRDLEPSPAVLSTGGGIVIREENWIELRRLGATVYLRASIETLVGRLERSKKRRPLIEAEDWRDRLEAIYEARRSLYERADYTVQVDQDDLAVAAANVYELLGSAS